MSRVDPILDAVDRVLGDDGSAGAGQASDEARPWYVGRADHPRVMVRAVLPSGDVAVAEGFDQGGGAEALLPVLIRRAADEVKGAGVALRDVAAWEYVSGSARRVSRWAELAYERAIVAVDMGVERDGDGWVFVDVPHVDPELMARLAEGIDIDLSILDDEVITIRGLPEVRYALPGRLPFT